IRDDLVTGVQTCALPICFGLEPARRNLLAFHLAVNRFSPEVVVFDTHWPYPVVGRLRERGIPAVLVLSPLARGMMGPALRVATRDRKSVVQGKGVGRGRQ